MTPVHIAAIWGRVENLKLLIGCGGDPSQRDFDGHSAFDYATREEQWEVFDYLHNVVDVTDEGPANKCAYTLDLGKLYILLNTASYSTSTLVLLSFARYVATFFFRFYY